MFYTKPLWVKSDRTAKKSTTARGFPQHSGALKIKCTWEKKKVHVHMNLFICSINVVLLLHVCTTYYLKVIAKPCIYLISFELRTPRTIHCVWRIKNLSTSRLERFSKLYTEIERFSKEERNFLAQWGVPHLYSGPFIIKWSIQL